MAIICFKYGIKVGLESESLKIFLNLETEILAKIIESIIKNGFFTSTFEKFVNNIIKIKDYYTNQEQFDSFIRALLKIDRSICNHDLIKQIINTRLDYLQERIDNLPTNSWIMSSENLFFVGNINNSKSHKKVNEFLRTAERKFHYEGEFHNITAAQKFAQLYSGIDDGYSIEIEAGGKGKKAYVDITKTREYTKERFQEKLDDLKQLLQ